MTLSQSRPDTDRDGDEPEPQLLPTRRLLGVPIAAVTEAEAIEHIATVSAGAPGRRGGWVLTANVDILHKLRRDPELRALVAPATLVVADGMPLLWASQLRGTPLPERVTGASLLVTLCAWAEGRRSVYLLGGAPGVGPQAVRNLRREHPGLDVDGWSPDFGVEATAPGWAEIRRRLREAQPDIVFCGFGFPKQERIIARLRDEFPDTWFVGCGAAITFAAGEISRAPVWMQRVGLEWLHRLCCEPRRLARRYLIEDLYFAVVLLVASAFGRSTAGVRARGNRRLRRRG